MLESDLVAASNAEFFMRVAALSPGGRAFELDGVRAAVSSAAPERPLLNSVAVLRRGALDEAAYERIAAAYAEAGVAGWTVWVDPADERTAQLLRSRGHVADAHPRTMAADVAEIAGEPSQRGGPLAPQPDMADFARVNDAVYGYPGSFERTVGRIPGGTLHTYAVLDGGDPVAVGGGVVLGSDLHISLVATLPEHRGRGHASRIIRRLAADSLARGCQTSTLVATKAGAPVYERLGYRDVGWLDMWELSVT
ncbi:MAG: GNAT family N-acetyltransferase [Gaiellales bacterium]